METLEGAAFERRSFMRTGRRPITMEAAFLCAASATSEFKDQSSVAQRLEIWIQPAGAAFGVFSAYRAEAPRESARIDAVFECDTQTAVQDFVTRFEPAPLAPAFGRAVAQGASMSTETLENLATQSALIKKGLLICVSKLLNFDLS